MQEVRELLTSQTSISQTLRESFSQIESSQSTLVVTTDKHHSETMDALNRRFDLVQEELAKVSF